MTPSVTFSSTVAAASLLVAALHLACSRSEPPPPAEPPRAIERRLTDTSVNERDGNWSPDGQWIVFGSSASGDEDIYKMPAGGGEQQQLTSGPSERPLPLLVSRRQPHPVHLQPQWQQRQCLDHVGRWQRLASGNPRDRPG